MAPRPSSNDTGIAELQALGAQVQQAIADYAVGKTQDTNDIARRCHLLAHRAEAPEVFAERLRYQPLSICALMIAIEGGMLQALASSPEANISAEQLAQITRRHKLDIVRTLRLLSALGACDEVGLQTYRANDKTTVLASKGQIGGFRVSSVPISAITTKVEEFFRKHASGEWEEEANVPSLHTYTYGQSMYDYLRDHRERRADFDAYMEARKQEKRRRWHHCYPVLSQLGVRSDVPADSSQMAVVDVGGNQGHDLATFQESNPDFRGRLILQDLPETVEPLLVDQEKQRVFEVMPYDFFTPQPVVGATLYLLLAVLHNWEDKECRAILKNLADAMAPGSSRLLISGLLLPDVGAERRAAELDMQMWMLQQSRQRTETEIRELVRSVGLDVAKVWENGDRESIVEVRKVESALDAV
ncbi:hypothetical protein PG993_000420 [Apiospora rasikravindrae]|uniref:O-methyltransferase C-terminal domain-containing protein n=1 Tax=Apiospora rasikravindrae TaxID=990691 RepID=A0ABR1U8I7_9PEZI